MKCSASGTVQSNNFIYVRRKFLSFRIKDSTLPSRFKFHDVITALELIIIRKILNYEQLPIVCLKTNKNENVAGGNKLPPIRGINFPYYPVHPAWPEASWVDGRFLDSFVPRLLEPRCLYPGKFCPRHPEARSFEENLDQQ